MVVSNLDKEALESCMSILDWLLLGRSHLLTDSTLFKLNPSHASVLNKSNVFSIHHLRPLVRHCTVETVVIVSLMVSVNRNKDNNNRLTGNMFSVP